MNISNDEILSDVSDLRDLFDQSVTGAELPVAAEQKEVPLLQLKKTSTLPSFQSVAELLDIRKPAKMGAKAENLLQQIRDSKLVSKSEVSYSLMEYQTKQLKRVSEQARVLHESNPEEAKLFFSNAMKKLGYTPQSVSVKDENGVEIVVEGWKKPENNFMVHTCPFWLINSKVAEPMVDTNLRDENFILNNNDKLCVSALNVGRGGLFQPDSRAGLIMQIPPKSILDTYSSDRLSPTGFRKSKEEVEKMSVADRLKYNTELKQIDSFIDLLKKYNGLTSYVKNVGDKLILTILQENNKLTDEDRVRLENLLAGLDVETKLSLIDPKNQRFEEYPALLRYMEELVEIYSKYGKDHDQVIGGAVFGSDEIDVGKQLGEIANFTKEMLGEVGEWKDSNIHPSAHKWEEAIRDRGETFAARLMPSSLHGPAALSMASQFNPGNFVELNVSTQDIDLTGFLLDESQFKEEVDLSEAQYLNLNEKIALSKEELTKLESQLKEIKGIDIKQLDAESQADYTVKQQEIEQKIKALKEQLNTYRKLEINVERTALLKFASTHYIPFVITGE